MRTFRLHAVVVIIAVLTIFVGCGLTSPDGALVLGGGYINGYLEDQDGTPLEGVTVTYSIPDDPVEEEAAAEAEAASAKGTQVVLTDASGFFEINELIPGNYRLTFTLAGYTIATDMVTLTPEGFFMLAEETAEEGGPPKYEYTDELIVTIYAKIATASGSIFMTTATGTSPAATQTVVAMFQDRFFSSVATDANGFFSFAGLPAGPVAFYARAFYSGTVFYENLWLTEGSYTDEFDNEIFFLDEADLSDRNEALPPQTWAVNSGDTPFVISGNLSQNFAVADSAVLTFNKAISIADFELWESADYPAGTPLDFALSWSGNTATINPDETLTVDTIYRLTYLVEATDGFTSGATATVLPDFRTVRGIRKIGSNVETLDDNQFADHVIGDDIELYFNMGIAAALSGEVILTDTTDGATNPVIDVVLDFATTPTTLVIDPVDDLEADHTYSLAWKVYSALDEGANSTASGITPGPIVFSTAAPVLTAPVGAPVTLTKASPTNLDHNTTAVAIEWDRVAGVSGYQVLAYSYDSADVTFTPIVEKTVILDIIDPGPSVYATTMQQNIDLAQPAFDAWPFWLDVNGDGIFDDGSTANPDEFIDIDGDTLYDPAIDITLVEPFSNDTTVRITVRAYNSDGSNIAASVTESPNLNLTDTTGPSYTIPSPTPTSDPLPALPAAAYTGTFRLQFLFSEAIAYSATYTPTAFINGGIGTIDITAGTGNTVLNIYTVDDQTVEAEFIVTGADINTGTTFQISVADTSGNSSPVTLGF
jgi:hypothetical protein